MNISIKQKNIDYSFDLICSRQAKGIAILLVILGHLNTEFYNWIFMQPLGTIGVTLFLFSSGYGLVKSYQRNGLDDFAIKRIKTVMFPYSTITFFWLIIDSLLGDNHSIIISLLALLGLDYTRTVDATMWYITFILFWYISFFLIFKYFKKNWLKVFISFCVSGVSLLIWSKQLVGGASYQWGVHALTFPAGIFYALYGETLIKKYKNKLIIPLFFTSVLSYYVNNMIGRVDGIHYLIADITSLIFIVIALIFIRRYGIRFKFIEIIGDYSYELYLIEGYLISKIINSNIIGERYSLLIYVILLLVLAFSLKKIVTYKKNIKSKYEHQVESE